MHLPDDCPLLSSAKERPMGAMAFPVMPSRPWGAPTEGAAVARSAQSRYSWRMDSRALPHCVLADLGWRWWHAAAVDPAHPSAKETPRDQVRIAIAAVPAST